MARFGCTNWAPGPVVAGISGLLRGARIPLGELVAVIRLCMVPRTRRKRKPGSYRNVDHWVIPRYGILPRLLANETAVFQQFALVGIVDWSETGLDCHISTRASLWPVVISKALS